MQWGAGNFFFKKSITTPITCWAVAAGIPVFFTTKSTSSFIFSPLDRYFVKVIMVRASKFHMRGHLCSRFCTFAYTFSYIFAKASYKMELNNESTGSL